VEPPDNGLRVPGAERLDRDRRWRKAVVLVARVQRREVRRPVNNFAERKDADRVERAWRKVAGRQAKQHDSNSGKAQVGEREPDLVSPSPARDKEAGQAQDKGRA